MKWILLFILPFFLWSCAKSGGNAPGSSVFIPVSIAISPTSLIVPKSISATIHVTGTDATGATSNLTASATCTSTSNLVSINTLGQVSNTYTGTSVQNSTLTCTYQGLTSSIPMTIVPATLQSLLMTKNTFTMVPGATQSIQVYGNFIDSISSYVFALDMTDYVTWTSSAASVVSATSGTVTAFAVGTGNITATFSSQSVSTGVTVTTGATTSYTPKGVGLTGTYYDFTTGPWSAVIGDPFEILYGSRIDSQVYFDWSTGTNNLNQVAYFGIRWTGRIYIPTTGSYTFYTQTDDGVRLWIDDVNGTPVINNWTLHSSTENTSVAIPLVAGQFYNVKMEYFENAGYSLAQLRWSGPSITKQLIPQIYLFPQ